MKENEPSFGIFETIVSITKESSNLIYLFLMNLGFNYSNYAP